MRAHARTQTHKHTQSYIPKPLTLKISSLIPIADCPDLPGTRGAPVAYKSVNMSYTSNLLQLIIKLTAEINLLMDDRKDMLSTTPEAAP